MSNARWSNLKNFIVRKNSKESLMSDVKKENQELENRYLPPFSSLVAVFNSKIRFYRVVLAVLSLVLVAAIIVEEVRLSTTLKSTLNKDYLVIPGATTFMKIRPGSIPDESLFAFSDWAVKQLDSFDYFTVESQYHELEKYMSPKLRTSFILESKPKIQKYKKFSVVQYAKFSNPDKILQKKDSDGTAFYQVAYDGVINRYSNDQKMEPISEKITLKFTTSSLEDTNRTFFFELIGIERSFYSDKKTINSNED